MNWWRNCSTAVSSDGQGTKTLQNYRRRLSVPQSHFWPTKTRESTPANANNSALAKKPIKKLSILSWTKVGSNLYQPRKAMRVSKILKINPMLRYFLSLTITLASNHLHISSPNWCEGSDSKGTLIEFLSRIILNQLLSHGDQSFPQYFYNCYVQVCN